MVAVYEMRGVEMGAMTVYEKRGAKRKAVAV